MTFEQRKNDVLSRKDRSSIGGWDKHILKLCNRINSFDEYYTSSSCSGRIMVMVDQDKKGPGLFKFTSHEIVDFDKFKKSIPKAKLNLKFKQEPSILHIVCDDLDSAKILLNKIRDAGWKRAGIISLSRNVIVEIIGTDKIEFPLMENGEILVSDYFLKLVIERANKNLKKGWDKIDKLTNLL